VTKSSYQIILDMEEDNRRISESTRDVRPVVCPQPYLLFIYMISFKSGR
jgi:hypothetical protein